MLTARDEVADRVAGLQAGADDYLVKPFALEELVLRLHALLRRRPPRSDAGSAPAAWCWTPARTATRDGDPLDLTRREFNSSKSSPVTTASSSPATNCSTGSGDTTRWLDDEHDRGLHLQPATQARGRRRAPPPPHQTRRGVRPQRLMVAAARSNTAAWARRVVHPRAWPVRWRLAAVSSGLTLVDPRWSSAARSARSPPRRIRDDFNGEVSNAAGNPRSSEVTRHLTRWSANRKYAVRSARPLRTDRRCRGPDLRPRRARARATPGTRGRLGKPRSSATSKENGMRVETAVLRARRRATGYVQYGRSTEHVDDTINRIWVPDLRRDRRRHRARAASPASAIARPGDAADRRADRERAGGLARRATPPSDMPGAAGRRRGRRAGGNAGARCCARWTGRVPSASGRCNNGASSSPTPRTSCAPR